MRNSSLDNYHNAATILEINPVKGKVFMDHCFTPNEFCTNKDNLNLIWYTKKQIAEIMQVHERTVSNWISLKKLSFFKPDNTVRISGQMLNEFINKYRHFNKFK